MAQAGRNKLKALSKLVELRQPLPVGTIVGDGKERIRITHCAYVDRELNAYKSPGPGREMMYFGTPVRLDRVLQRFQVIRTGMDRILASNVRSIISSNP